jgi:succinate dehydrogenase/fumarate reductase flavoprotein subunit
MRPVASADYRAPKSIAESDSIRLRHLVQNQMTAGVGIVRTTKGLRESMHTFQAALAEYNASPDAPFSRHALETRNIIECALQTCSGAINRPENVGLHYNSDLA